MTTEYSRRQELQELFAENDANKRLVEKLKVEKSHLVETVLSLSNEVDELEKAKACEHQKYKNELLKNSELDEKVNNIKLTLCQEVTEVLRDHNIDISIIEIVKNKINAVVQNNSDGLSTTTLSGKSGITTNTISSSGKSPTNRRRNKSVSRDLLDRDDTDSVISSVSTHRSNRSPKKYHSSKKNSPGITKESLDMLNDERGDSPQSKGESKKNVRRTKQVDPETAEIDILKWWDNLFV